MECHLRGSFDLLEGSLPSDDFPPQVSEQDWFTLVFLIWGWGVLVGQDHFILREAVKSKKR